MEPQLPSPEAHQESYNIQSERLPKPSIEQPLGPKRPEQAISEEQKGTEQQTQSSGGGDPTWQAQNLASTSAAISQQAQSPMPTQPFQATPLTAKDDDLIEQEWVQKAKKIVANTKDDPYLQEQEVNKLQADYLQKRYGKELKLPSD